MLDLTSLPPGFHTDPGPIYDLLLDHAPVCRQPDGSFLLAAHADLNSVYRDTQLFVSDKRAVFEPKFGAGTPLFEHHTTSLVFNDPPLHTRVRRIMSSALTPRALQRMTPGLIRTVDRLLDELPPKADLIAEFASRIPIEVIGNLLDVPAGEREPLRDWSLSILGALEPVLSPAQQEKGNAAVTGFSDYLADLIRRRRLCPGDPETDVLTRLIKGDPEGQLSPAELIHNCIFILNAGHETTTNLIGSALALLHDNPSERTALLNNPDLIDTAVEEVLRCRSPNQFGNRVTTRDVQFQGVVIPAGSNLHLCIGAANRDPSVFTDPGRFDIRRTPNRHLAFGGGPHVCVGLTLARMEGRIAVDRFLRRWPDYTLTDRTEAGRVRFRGYETLVGDLAGRSTA
ncbi:cytochrome P450 [uncultured Roseobacter sp.]|uniref:cytochrome P450 n=1 Tax=uncultured Roseobacter sp. TaxID=114847 RepID=UPI0026078953|nr:cytochrome P450 [uncultured Roseobacter sp.]